jgi:murein DD-endopeptidase MepM/ murein hydrolase activator NlpD
MTGQNPIIQNILRRLQYLTKKITPAFWLPFLAGTLVLLFFSLTLLLSDPGSYTDELGFTGDNDKVTIQETPQKKAPAPVILREEIKPGDSLYSILISKGATPTDADGIAKQLKSNFSIRAFRPGQSYETEKSGSGALVRFSYFQDKATTIHVEKDNATGIFKVRREVTGYDTKIASVEGTVTSSLSQALQSSNRTSLLAGIKPLFASQINFRHDIKPGTKYRILFEEKWLKNEFISTGKILAVELTQGNHTYKAYQYTDSTGKSSYFDENGNALEHTALFTPPCSYSHISSGFGFRIHPITRTWHFHGGVDMVAPTGTPVHAVADGKIVFCGRNGGAGNMVTLSHSGGYYTQYLHLSHYALKEGSGTRVHQGEIIGYVGSTGSSTGPHLDFRMIRNSKPMNPIAALGTSTSRSLSRTEMGHFLASINIMKAKLDNNQVLIAGASQRKGEAIL